MKDLTIEEKLDRIMAYQEIQNVMGKHCWYHFARQNREEIEAIWAKKTPGVSWTTDRGKWEGMDALWELYVTNVERNKQKALERVIQVRPEVENKEENWGIGTLCVHTLTTPVIEVALDGKTAKGIWYSPGQVTEIGADGRPNPRWMWERYGADFVKEDGEWKLWHIHMYYDVSVPVGESWADTPPIAEIRAKQKEAQAKWVDSIAKPNKPGERYDSYSPTTLPQQLPKIPQPYVTFDEKDAY